MKNFEKLVDHSFEIMKIEISKKDKDSGENIKKAIKNYYEVLIYNVVSIAVVIALSNDTKKLNQNHIDNVKDYIKTKCSSRKMKGGKCGNVAQIGGTSLPGEYFGYSIDPSRYSAGNGSEESVSTVNFAAGIARPEITTSTSYADTTMKGGAVTNAAELHHFVCMNSSVKAYVREILKQHSLSISTGAIGTLLHIIEVHVHCVLKDLKLKGPLTLKKVDSVFNNKAHAIFH